MLDHATQLDVDHVVALKEAWDSGANDWEHGRLRNLLTGPCEGATLDEGLPVRPPPPVTTTTLSTSTTVVAGDADVVIANIVYDAPGNDVEYNNSEYVVLTNTGSGTADGGSWWLVDEKDHRITIPSSYSIAPGGELRVYTGPGDSTATRYFDGRGQAIWNNSGGDTAELFSDANVQIDEYSHSS